MNGATGEPTSAASSRGNAPGGARPTEHYVTLFDDSFLPLGLALYQSLVEHAQPFHLWAVAVDEAVEAHLRALNLPRLSVIPLGEMETPELLAVKADRTRGEYCWTITPFVCQAVLDREPAAARATYVDADVLFLDDPRVLLAELDASGKHVLITEHAFAPEYDRSHDSGRFCVQFVTFDRSAEARRVMTWWQERCLEWCFARYEAGRFGDQMYLDHFPTLFGPAVHVVQQVEKTLAPWNVRHFAERSGREQGRDDAWRPVMFHFHGFRLLGPTRARLYRFYDVGREGNRICDLYVSAVSRALRTLNDAGIKPQFHTLPPERFGWWHRVVRRLNRTERYARVS